MKKWKETLRQAKRRGVLGPCEGEGKLPKGGVGFVIKDNLTVVESQIKTEDFRRAYDQGLVAKCEVDYGARQNINLYEVYGCSGGSTKAIAKTNRLMMCINAEMQGEECNPTVVIGDFNHTPSKLESIRYMIEEEGWTDVGEKADWWGGRKRGKDLQNPRKGQGDEDRRSHSEQVDAT